MKNGGYINPPRVKRQFRDPNADWWDKQERRNYGEPVHEDNDILGIFSPEEYTHQKVGTAGFQFGLFILSVLGLCTVVGMMYPDKQSAPREFEGGLERELGGPTAVRVSYGICEFHELLYTDAKNRPELRETHCEERRLCTYEYQFEQVLRDIHCGAPYDFKLSSTLTLSHRSCDHGN